MLDFNAFISDEIATAPEHPLAKNLGHFLSDTRITSQPEIWEIQRRDRIPGILRRMLPLNPTLALEYWWCIPGRMLLSEDVELLNSDRSRLETILAKLVWLLGGHCFSENSRFDRDCEPTYDWQQIIAFVRDTGLKPDLLDIDFMPAAIAEVKLPNANGTVALETPNYLAVAPSHWHIEFFQLQPIEGGFKLQEPKPICSCQIWTGKPYIKNLQTEEIVTRYDLSMVNPLDFTISPGLFSTAMKDESK